MISLNLNNPNLIFNRIVDRDVKIFAHTRLHAYCSPFVPMDTGMLDQNVDINDKNVHYKSPYAHINYWGVNRNFSKEKHPLATAEWDKFAMLSKGDNLANEITNYIKRK